MPWDINASTFMFKISLFFCLSVCLSVFLSACLCICVSVCLSVYLSICLPICLCVCLCVCLFVCLSFWFCWHRAENYSTAWLVATLVYSWLVFTTNWADQCITFSTPAGGDSAAATSAAEGASGAVVGIDIQFDFPGAEPSQGSDRMPKSLNLRLADGAADLHRDL